MGFISAAAQENPVAFRDSARRRPGTGRRADFVESASCRADPAVEYRLEKARRMLSQRNVDPGNLHPRPRVRHGPWGVDRLRRGGKALVEFAMRDALPTLGHNVPGKAVRSFECHFGAGPETFVCRQKGPDRSRPGL